MAIDTIFLDSGVLRAYIDKRDAAHPKAHELIEEYFDLKCRFYTTTLNISELSFWLDKSRARYGTRMRALDRMVRILNLEICEIGESWADLVFRDWLVFCRSFRVTLDFADFYLYQVALQKGSDYLMTTDRADFGKILALAPSCTVSKTPRSRSPFTHDDIIFI